MRAIIISVYQGILSVVGAWALLYSGVEWNIYAGTLMVTAVGIGWAIPDRLAMIKMMEDRKDPKVTP